jgi:predicted DNA binding protein
MEDDDANSVVASKKIKLSDITMNKMLDAIENGQKKQVEQALDKYELTDTQWKVIQTAFKNN